MKVKIISAQFGTYWYADKIGGIYDVEEVPDEDFHYRVMGERRYIQLEDCVLWDENTEIISHYKKLAGEVDVFSPEKAKEWAAGLSNFALGWTAGRRDKP